MPPSMLHDVPQIDRSTVNPLDLGSAQTHWKRKAGAPDEWFMFGSGQWTRSANIDYLLDEAGAVHGWANRAEVRYWPNLAEFFAAELVRAEEGFPAHEAWFAKVRRDAMSPLSRAKRWLKGALGR
jgi:hypothetical protein